MTTFSFGDIVLLDFPFSDTSGIKRRPAMVICDTRDGDIVVCRVTSASFGSLYELPVSEWQDAGLLFASYIKLHKMATLERLLVNRKLGQLTESDMALAKEKLAGIVSGIIRSQ
jgi:mRNA-degrading endonuclease toxin of MazEF toxin-antitoxin module